jgi:hypothetical protein
MTKTYRNLYFAFALFCVVAIKPGLLIPDGLGYYSYLPSLFLDGDLNFWNEFRFGGYIQENGLTGAELSSTGYVTNPWGVGASILWLPFWLLAHILTILLKSVGLPWAVNGFSLFYNLAVRFATALFGFCGMLAGGIWVSRYTKNRMPWLAILLITLGTPYYWYCFAHADMSHIPTAFLITMFLIVLDIRRKAGPDLWLALAMGLLGGFVSISRPHDVFIMILPLLLWSTEWKSEIRGWKDRILDVMQVCAGFLLPVLLQIWIWMVIYGSPFGPAAGKGVTGYYYFFTGEVHFYDVLFSSYHGLFFFSPLLLFSLWGLGRLAEQDKLLSLGSILILASQITLMAMEKWFWEGQAFGLRRLVDWSPLYLLGLSVLTSTARSKALRVCLIICTLWTVMLALVYVWKPPYVLNQYQPPNEIFTWIIELLSAFPESIKQRFAVEITLSGLVPCLLLLSLLGYAIFRGSLTLASIAKSDSAATQIKWNQAIRRLTAVCILPLFLTYLLVFRANLNGEASLEKYSRELNWLGERSGMIHSYAVSYFTLNKAKYFALTQGWEAAERIFREALEISPNRHVTRNEIAKIAEGYMEKKKAQAYVSRLADENQRSR